MADQRSVETLALNFPSRTFAYQRVAQDPRRSLPVVSSFMREGSDPVIKTDQRAEYVDDIGIAANSPEQLITNLQAVFKSNKNAGLNLSVTKCHFGTKKVDFLG